MSPVVCPIPFAMWGIDLVGPFLKPPVRYKDVVVAVDYFSKWVEAAPLRSMTANAIEEFLWKNITNWYGVPKILVPDNGLQFDAKVIKEMCTKLGIEHNFALGHRAWNLRDRRTLREADHTWHRVYLKKYYA
ncbi:hypothetical protein LIER_29923 [Lithospermum erythrorhizon]|uniref:Integrase catalytic domain-containing protein n=1 Tax=Lithospermum erythrorhizon TaxID=34254 RepID=A0AAV3RRQ9_LITER